MEMEEPYLQININIQNKIKSLRAHGKGKNKYDTDYIGIN